ncbi:MAG: hypothetical protein JWM33_4014 [Caulobacteraceae bacterium]|nr:hypothetical protein [Caulobacteraceae bacterium]
MMYRAIALAACLAMAACAAQRPYTALHPSSLRPWSMPDDAYEPRAEALQKSGLDYFDASEQAYLEAQLKLQPPPDRIGCFLETEGICVNYANRLQATVMEGLSGYFEINGPDLDKVDGADFTLSGGHGDVVVDGDSGNRPPPAKACIGRVCLTYRAVCRPARFTCDYSFGGSGIQFKADDKTNYEMGLHLIYFVVLDKQGRKTYFPLEKLVPSPG